MEVSRDLLPETDAPSAGWKVRRLLLVLAVCSLVFAIAAPVTMWLRYRHAHVLSRNALVRGHIADVGAQFRGVVAEVLVDAGDRVEAGQMMARLEDRHLLARVERARSELEKAERELAVERLAIAQQRRSLESTLAEATARVAAARADAEAADSRAEDAREIHELRVSLSKEGVVPRELVRQAQADLRTANALLFAAGAEGQAAEAAQRSARVDYEGLAVREERISVLESRVAAYGAELAVAQADLETTRIRAPSDGRVVRRIAEPGTSLDYGEAIISLWMGSRVWVEAWIDEGDVVHVAVGSPATVTLKPYPDRVFEGIVEAVGVSTDYEIPESDVPQPRHTRMRGTPVVLVRVGLDDPAGHLVPGLSAVVGIRKNAQGIGPPGLVEQDATARTATGSR
jgi:multidrug resistance efflux pump